MPPPPDAAGNSSVSEPNNNNLAVSGIVCKKSNKRLDANIKHNSNSASIVMDSTVGDDVIDHISTIDVSGSTYDGQLAFDESEFGSDVL